MATALKRTTVGSRALKLAQRAWRIQYMDSSKSITLARQALERARSAKDDEGHAWAMLTCGFHAMRYATPAEGLGLLESARQLFDESGNRRGLIVATAGIARCWWIQGRHRESLDLLLPLRGEGLQVLAEAERGMLLNGIAGCYSMLGEPAQAFAYMYQAMRESSPARNHGFDVVLYCNLSHELLQLGDFEEGLTYAQQGIERCVHLRNPRLLSVLLLNRMACLIGLHRNGEALADVHRLLEMPADVGGRGATNPGFEQMALTALRAGDLPMGATLIERAVASQKGDCRPDAWLELVIARSELSRLRGNPAVALQILEEAMPLPAGRLSLHVRCMYFEAQTDAFERSANAERALQALRAWQALHLERSRMASQARHQAMSLKTELMRLQRERDEIDAKRQSTEKARSELEATNQQLAQRILQVQALQNTLREQAVRDGLTGLFNRRHLSSVLPSMVALAKRNGWPLSVAIIDLDRFKSINDQYGHLVGDAVLRSFAELLLDHLRKSDIVCRYGGEEFCVLMPRTSLAQALRKLEALRKRWRAVRLEVYGQQLGQYTFSAGVADSTAHASPASTTAEAMAEDLLKRADDCAMQAKRSGRDRVLQLHAGQLPETA